MYEIGKSLDIHLIRHSEDPALFPKNGTQEISLVSWKSEVMQKMGHDV